MISIYVGNLKFTATEQNVREMFEQFGPVNNLKMIKDRETGRFRGFAFIEMDREEGLKAIEALNDNELDGRKLKVNEARELERPQGGGSKNSNG
ncbi:MAG: RNA-binding protein [Ignavibacteria bacterium]|nr:RNA-binding protein [Ignavibacteria bacterium]